MSKKNSINLSDYSQEEIDRVLAMKTKDRSDHETRIYKKKKFVDWSARGCGKAPKAKKVAKTVDTIEDMIERNTSPIKVVEETKTEDIVRSRPRYRHKTKYTQPCDWMIVPDEDQMDKDKLLRRQCLVVRGNKTMLCRITGKVDDPICFDVTNHSVRFQLTWPQAYIGWAYAVILRLPTLSESISTL